MENCRNLQTKLTKNDSSDVDAIELFEELKLLCRLFKLFTTRCPKIDHQSKFIRDLSKIL